MYLAAHLAPQVFEYLFQMVHTNAVVVQLDGGIVDIAASKEVQRAGEAELFDDDGIASSSRTSLIILDAPVRSLRYQDFVHRNLDAAIGPELVNDELAQRENALRPIELYMEMYLGSPLNTFEAASMNPSIGTESGSLCPPMKLYFGCPPHLAGGAGRSLLKSVE